MLEKFTEKAVNVVSTAQKCANEMHSANIVSEHLLLALYIEAKGFPQKMFKSYDITYEDLYREVTASLNIDHNISTDKTPVFSNHLKELLKNALDLANKSGNPAILYEHLFLAVINDRKSNNVRILEKLGFDIVKFFLKNLYRERPNGFIIRKLTKTKILTQTRQQQTQSLTAKSQRKFLNVQSQSFQPQTTKFSARSRLYRQFWKIKNPNCHKYLRSTG